MKIDLTCPVELWHYALPEKQYPFCRLQLFNMTEQTVVSVQAVFTCYDGEGMLLSRQVERVQRLDGRPRSAFEMTVDIQNGLKAAGMDFSVERYGLKMVPYGAIHQAAGRNSFPMRCLPVKGCRCCVLWQGRMPWGSPAIRERCGCASADGPTQPARIRAAAAAAASGMYLRALTRPRWRP